MPDLSRRCPAVDPDDHHLYASLGCAAENLLLAAQAAGLRGEVSYDPSSSSLRVELEEAPPIMSALFDAIPKRQCSRAEYDGSELTAEELTTLAEAGRGEGVSLVFLTTKRQKEQVAEYVAAGNTAQFVDRAWARELRAWIRFNRREAERRGDGLYGPSMGSPDVPRWLGELFMRVAFSAKRQNEKDVAHIRSSAAVAVLVSEADDEPHWIEAGRSYERLALQAAAMELRTAFINQPVEVPALRAELAGFAKPRMLGRSLGQSTVRRATALAFLSVLLVSIIVFALLLVEQKDPHRLLFEAVSAFGTVGLTTGITSSLSVPGKIVVMMTMFIGRVGPMTLALALAAKSATQNIELPEERLGIG